MAQGRGVGPPVAFRRAELRLPTVEFLLLHLLRGVVELVHPLFHDLVAILWREEVAATDNVRRTIVQAPGRHEVFPPLQQFLDGVECFRAARHVLSHDASVGHGVFHEEDLAQLPPHVRRGVVGFLHFPQCSVELGDLCELWARRHGRLRSSACGRSVGSGGLFGLEGLLRGRGRHGRLRSTACGASAGRATVEGDKVRLPFRLWPRRRRRRERQMRVRRSHEHRGTHGDTIAVIVAAAAAAAIMLVGAAAAGGRTRRRWGR